MTDLLTVEEIAAEVHETMKVSTVRKAIRDKHLKAEKRGRRYYATREDVRKWMTCPVPKSPPASTNAPTPANGSSGMEAKCSAQARAEAMARELLNSA